MCMHVSLYLCIYVCTYIGMCVYVHIYERKGNIVFNDTFNTFYLRLYGVRHMVKDHSDSERAKPAAAT